MTFRQKAQQEQPEIVNDSYVGGVRNCPESYGYEETRDDCPGSCETNCAKCWDREMPGAEPIKEAPKHRGVVYLAGPITGVPNYWEAFEKMDDCLSSRGWTVLSPARHPQGLTNADYMRIDFAMIDTADVVLFLPGWQNSEGAKLEKHYCEYTSKSHTEHIENLEEVLTCQR